jgi:SAM-dependent methyltransferase
MPAFKRFDQRGYRTVSARHGYGAWQPTYEESVQDIMDLRLLDQVSTVRWSDMKQVADLGCGTGRTAAWLESQGVTTIDGVDVTPEMLEVARVRGLHRRLELADVRRTGLPAGAYDLVVCALVDEHLPELHGLYSEARRLLGVEGTFVLVGYHPFFIMASGMPTHFDGPDGEPVAIETHVHLQSAHMDAARAAGFVAAELREGLIDDEWIERKPKWSRHRDWPISFAWVWRTDR